MGIALKKTLTKKEKRKYWPQMIEHIDSTWRKKKKSEFGYPFTGKDMADLRHFCATFEEWGLMALWDEYLDDANDEEGFNKKTGWTVFHFTRQLPRLLDGRTWKSRATKYERQLIGPVPEEIADLFSLAMTNAVKA